MGEPLGTVDTAWLHMDRPENTADVVAVLHLGAVPEPERVRALVGERLLAHDRFRQRVVPGAFLARDRWEEDPVFLLDRHLRRRRLDPGERALHDAVDAAVNERLDPVHPLWRFDVLETEGRAALVAKIHHCLADGFALVAVLLALADDPVPHGDGEHALPAYRRAAPWLGPPRTLAAELLHPARALSLLAQAGTFALALARMTLQRDDPRTALTPALSGVRRVAWSRGLPWAELRAAARARGIGANDLLVAAIAGALRDALGAEGFGVEALALRALVPVNLRLAPPEGAHELGNRFGLAYLDLPVRAATPADRLAGAARGMSRAKTRPDALVTFGMLAAVGLLPPALGRAAVQYYSRKASLVITSVPGPRKRLHLAGAEIEGLMFWVPHPATLGVGVSVLSYAGEVRVGVRADVAAVPDPAALVARIERELDALSRR